MVIEILSVFAVISIILVLFLAIGKYRYEKGYSKYSKLQKEKRKKDFLKLK